MKRIIGFTAAAGALAAAALAATPAQAQFRGDRYGYDRGFERHAVALCRAEAQRRHARGGARVDIRNVNYGRGDRIRVLGAVEPRFGRFDRRWDGRADRRDRRFDGRIAFSCEVNSRGRISRFRTHNYAW